MPGRYETQTVFGDMKHKKTPEHFYALVMVLGVFLLPSFAHASFTGTEDVFFLECDATLFEGQGISCSAYSNDFSDTEGGNNFGLFYDEGDVGFPGYGGVVGYCPPFETAPGVFSCEFPATVLPNGTYTFYVLNHNGTASEYSDSLLVEVGGSDPRVLSCVEGEPFDYVCNGVGFEPSTVVPAYLDDDCTEYWQDAFVSGDGSLFPMNYLGAAYPQSFSVLVGSDCIVDANSPHDDVVEPPAGDYPWDGVASVMVETLKIFAIVITALVLFFLVKGWVFPRR